MRSVQSSVEYLPLFSDLVPKALRKGLKSTIFGISIKPEGIHLDRIFDSVFVDLRRLERYRQFFGFQEPFPLPYLFLLAQRAQLALMLTKEYTIGVPGIIHLSSVTEKLGKFILTEPFDLHAALDVEYKEQGSLRPVFTLKYFQAGTLVATSTNHYLVRRKAKGAKSNTKRLEEPFAFENSPHEDTWAYSSDLSIEYADVTDDHNPIHKSKRAARFAGFPSPIMHGWYSVSRATKWLTSLANEAPTSMKASFHKPLFLPGNFDVKAGTVQDTGELGFELTNDKDEIALKVHIK